MTYHIPTFNGLPIHSHTTVLTPNQNYYPGGLTTSGMGTATINTTDYMPFYQSPADILLAAEFERANNNPLTIRLKEKLPEKFACYVYNCARVVDLEEDKDYVRVRFVHCERPTELRESYEHFPSEKLVGQLLLLLGG